MQLTRQNEDLKEIIANYDRNLGQKDTIIRNLSTTIGKQKSKENIMRSFSKWKLRCTDERREVFIARPMLARNILCTIIPTQVDKNAR